MKEALYVFGESTFEIMSELGSETIHYDSKDKSAVERCKRAFDKYFNVVTIVVDNNDVVWPYFVV